MNKKSNDAGVIAAMLNRLEIERLPRMLAMQQRVKRGESLNEIEMDYLQRVFGDAKEAWTLIERHPEYHDLVTRMINLYREITAKALENEKNAK